MPAQMLDAVSIDFATRRVHKTRDLSLAASAQELAILRSSILLTAKWKESSSEDPERRSELRTELVNLGCLYLERIDAIAMRYGVGKAMELKEQVERTITAQ